jgi:dienelactone hydrolase
MMSELNPRQMVAADVQARTGEAMRLDAEAWGRVRSVADWERFRDERLDDLRSALGLVGDEPEAIEALVTGELPGDGYRIRKLVFETRPGVRVTALLYLPDPLPASMPGIQIVHAHHRPKHQIELQDMGVNWARNGSAVLIPDLVGHGERGDDPFGERQGYYARYYEAIQLGLIGESLAGWMVADLICGTSVLLDLPGIDPERIVLIGAVAGGGDLSAMAAAFDDRVTCSIPFNYGGSKRWRTDLGDTPDVPNLCGVGYWETTRNLRDSAVDGFLPYVIVAAAAPRHLIYAHEFAWDEENDEAWHRIRHVYELYGASDRLGSMKGEGRCAPGAGNTHCTNVGAFHRSMLYPYLERWFAMPAFDEIEDRREPDELACLTPELAAERRPLREIAAEKYLEQMARNRRTEGRPEALRASTARLRRQLAMHDTPRAPDAELSPPPNLPLWHAVESIQALDDAAGPGETVRLRTADRIVVPLTMLRPAGVDRPPVVVGVASGGSALFHVKRCDEIDRLLAHGVAVCLADVRGTGESSIDDSHGLNSRIISLSEDLRVLGSELLGLRLADLLSVIAWLRTRDDVRNDRIAVWGDSFAPVNPPDYTVGEHDRNQVDHDNWPNPPYGGSWAEPAGSLLALGAAQLDGGVCAVLARGGLASFAGLYDDWAFRVPSDTVGPWQEEDVADIVATVLPRPVRLEGCVDANNRALDQAALEATFNWEPSLSPCGGAPELSAELGDAAAWISRAMGL